MDSKVLTRLTKSFYNFIRLQYNQGNMEKHKRTMLVDLGQTLQNTWHQNMVNWYWALFFQHPDEEGHTALELIVFREPGKLLAANPLPGQVLNNIPLFCVIPVPPLQALAVKHAKGIRIVNIHRAIAFGKEIEPDETLPVYLQRHVISRMLPSYMDIAFWQYVKGQQHYSRGTEPIATQFGDGRPRGVTVIEINLVALPFRDYTPARYLYHEYTNLNWIIQGQDEVISLVARPVNPDLFGNALRLTSVGEYGQIFNSKYAGEPEYEDIEWACRRKLVQKLNRSAGNGHLLQEVLSAIGSITLAAHVKNNSQRIRNYYELFSQAELNQVAIKGHSTDPSVNLRYF
ncbi:hypothetical protein SPFM12_00285 [Salmonella phage SPFM12]|nr:hypothetical protein SPFM12_00285 [Salmonella phage SPFM12]